MKLESRNEKRNDALKRTEYEYILSHPMSATPSRKDIQKMVSSELGVSPKRVEIRKIYSFFGQPKTRIRVYVWDEEKVEDLNEEKQETAGEANEQPKEGE